MINHLSGKLVEKSPIHAIIECNGVGYFVHISVHTFSSLPDKENCKLFTHFAVREDAQTLFGFGTEEERSVFRKLISVSGVGASTGRMIMSSLSPDEVKHAILNGDSATIKQVKGIGAKTAQRIIIDLQDKIGKVESNDFEKVQVASNTIKSEALSALFTLGFDKTKANKTLDRILMKEGDNITVEELIKLALKQL